MQEKLFLLLKNFVFAKTFLIESVQDLLTKSLFNKNNVVSDKHKLQKNFVSGCAYTHAVASITCDDQ